MRAFEEKSLFFHSMVMVTAAVHVPSAPGKANEAQTPGDGCVVSHTALSKDVNHHQATATGTWTEYKILGEGKKLGMKLTID